MLMSSIIAFQTNVVLTVPCLTGPQQGGVRALVTKWVLIELDLVFKPLESRGLY